MKAAVTMRRALSDKRLLGGVLAGDSWRAWRTMLIAAWGEALDDDERTLFVKLTGRSQEPGRRVEEFVGVIGRRGGKSRAIATLAAYIAGLCNHRRVLVPGETGIVLCIAPDQRQAAITLDYATAAFQATPILKKLIANRNADTLELTTGIRIEVRAASFRRLRGPTYVAVIADEAAFWRNDESANPDSEILNAVRPGLATTNGLLAIISSPYARRGEVWEAYRTHYGHDDDPLVLVAQGTSRDFNPTLPQSVVDRALERDPAAASAEFLAIFRTDIESFINREVVDAATVPGRFELPPAAGTNCIGFADAAGGSGTDSFTAAVAYLDRATNHVVLAAVRERRPSFSPETTIEELSAFFRSYGVHRISADRWGGEFPVEQFRKHGIACEVSEKVKSDIYKELLPLLNSGRVELLDNHRLIVQLTGLERRTARGGKDSIDHAPGGHDDLINAAAGAIVAASGTMNKAEQWAAFARAALPPSLSPTSALPLSAISFAEERQRRNH